MSTTTVSDLPVEFDPYSDDFFNSPFETYRRMRDEAPVYYSARHDFYALTRYEDVAPAYKDFATYSSAKGITIDMMKLAGARRGLGQAHHHDGPAESRAVPQVGEQGVHPAGGRVA